MYILKRAETAGEFEQIHRLNYETFVKQLGQHPDTGTGSLVDKFHGRNLYFIVVCHARVAGIVAVHDDPPFSIADRLADLGALDRLGSRLLEVRLLAVAPQERNRAVFPKLICAVYRHACAHGHSHLLISGLQERLGLYRRLGFRALGPAVPCGRASFVPMSLAVDAAPACALRMVARYLGSAIRET